MREDLDILLKVLQHSMRGGPIGGEDHSGTAMLDGDGSKDFGNFRQEHSF